VDDLILILAEVVGGFALLIKGGDWLVQAGAEIARKLGVSVLVIGLTVVAWGTSAPEVVVSGLAALQDSEELSMGNVLGSNVANIGLVLGACALVLPRVLERTMRPREILWLLVSVGALWILCLDEALTRTDGWILLGLFALHNVHVFLTARKYEGGRSMALGSKAPGRELLFGVIGLAVGAYLVVEGGRNAGDYFGLPRHVVGLTLLAVGTSLPELAAGLAAAFRGVAEISLGNVVGSNVFNLLMALGLVTVIRPFVDGAQPGGVHPSITAALHRDLPVVVGFSLAALLLPLLAGAKAGRLKGAALLLAYAVYVWLLVNGGW